MNLDIYKKRELQTVIAMLNQFESEGITDVRFMREKLHGKLHDSLRKVGRVKPIRKTRSIINKPCPDCGNMMVRSKYHPALTCRKCLHSEEI